MVTVFASSAGCSAPVVPPLGRCAVARGQGAAAFALRAARADALGAPSGAGGGPAAEPGHGTGLSTNQLGWLKAGCQCKHIPWFLKGMHVFLS